MATIDKQIILDQIARYEADSAKLKADAEAKLNALAGAIEGHKQLLAILDDKK